MISTKFHICNFIGTAGTGATRNAISNQSEGFVYTLEIFKNTQIEQLMLNKVGHTCV